MTHFLRRSASPNTGVSLCWDFSPPFGAGQKAGQAPGLPPSLGSSGDRKTLPLVAVSCECRRTTFPALRMVCPRQKERYHSFCALLISSAAPGSSLTRRVALCPTPCWGQPQTPLGLCPDFSELARKNCPARATAPWTAELASRFEFPLCAAPPHRYLFFCTPLLAAELRRPR